MQLGSFFLKHFHLLNPAGLILLGGLFWLKDAGAHPLSWPGTGFLSVFLLSTLFFYAAQSSHTRKVMILSGLLFPLLHWVLTGVLTVVLERFFRLTEHYSFSTFDRFLTTNRSLLIDGLLWWAVYACLFHWQRSHVKLLGIKHINMELEKATNRSDLNTLRKEVDSHFLFNAMNGIAMKVRLKENKTAVRMIAALNDLLRLSLGSRSGEQLITVAEELDLLDKYLLIERHRFGDKVIITVDFPDDTKDALLPELILQPLVENAFKHGMNSDNEEQAIRIAGRKAGSRLELTVYNTQITSRPFNYARSGIGLPNIARRLRRLYGPRFQFQSFNSANGVTFKVTIPFAS